MSEHQGILDTIFDLFSPVHPDGHKFIAIGAVVTLAFFLLYPPLGWIAALITAWIVYFFRDPPRVTPLRPGLVISAADGKISSIDKVAPPAELGMGSEERVRISTFLSIFDVHINRAPVAGRIVRSLYVPGAFLNAALDKASEDNECRILVIDTPSDGEIGVVQIAGLVARRIVTFSQIGETVGAGQRLGSSDLAPGSMSICHPEKSLSSASGNERLQERRFWPIFIRRSRSGNRRAEWFLARHMRVRVVEGDLRWTSMNQP